MTIFIELKHSDDSLNVPPTVTETPVRLLQPLDPGLALLRRPHVAHHRHPLRYVGEDVPVADAGFQALLHVVRSPNFHETHRLVLRPRCVCTISTYDELQRQQVYLKEVSSTAV